TDQSLHVTLLEHVANQAVVLAQEQLADVTGDDPSGILATVLQNRKRVIQRLIDVRLTDDADNATHARTSQLIRQIWTWPAKRRRVRSKKSERVERAGDPLTSKTQNQILRPVGY